MENYNESINNLYKKQNFLEKNEPTNNEYVAAEENNNESNVMQCYAVNQDTQIFIDNANVYQTEDGQIYYACLSSNTNDYDPNNQPINIISQEQLSNMMMTNSGVASNDAVATEESIAMQNYYSVPTNQLQYIKYEDEDYRNDSYFKYQECSICNAAFSTKKSFLKHMMIHENDRDHKCSLCKLSYNHEVNLLVHMAVVHTDECFENVTDACLRCPICDCVFSRKKALQGHCLTHQVDEEVMCDHCPQSFKSRILLKEHLMQVENGEVATIPKATTTTKLLRCKLCHEVFENVGKIKKHYAREHPKGKSVWHHQVVPEPQYTAAAVATIDPEFDATHLSEEESEDIDFSPDKANNRKRKSSKRAIQTIKLYAQSKNKQSGERDKSIGIGGRKRGRPRKEESTGNSKHGYSCTACSKNFKTPVLLRRHEVTHTGFKAFECHICKKRFTQKSSVKIHMEVHKNVKSFKCKHCYKTFTYEHNMKTHMRVVHKEHSSSYYRDTYIPRVGRRGRPRKTYQTPLGGLPDELEVTQYLWNENAAYQSHPGAQSGNMYVPSTSVWDQQAEGGVGILVSEDVERVDAETGAIQVHELIKDHVTGFKRFRCRFCCKLYKNSCDLTRHLRIHLQEKPFLCYICRKSFRLKSVLKTHYKSHWKLKEYNCETCSKSFNLKQTLKIHQGLHDPDSLRYECKFCDKKFNTFSHYKYHLFTHQRKSRRVVPTNSLEPVLCEDAVKIEETQSAIYNDNQVEERPFKCQYCSKSYKLKKYLQEHFKEHFDINKHYCNHCGKQFITLRSLQQHLRVQHLNRTRYNCELCEAQFLTKSSLKRHALVHSDDKPYMCPICKKKFKARLYCERHIKKGNCQNIDSLMQASNTNFIVASTEDLDVTNDSPGGIYIGNYIGNFADYSNAQKYIVNAGDQSSSFRTEDQSFVIAESSMDPQSITHQDSETALNSQNYISLLENQMDSSSLYVNQQNPNIILDPSTSNQQSIDVMQDGEAKQHIYYETENDNMGSLGDRFPILKASLFSEEEVNPKKHEPIPSTSDHVPDQSIPSTSQYIADIKPEDGKMYHGCANCEELFPDSNELAIHVKNTHKLDKNYVCQVCYKAFSAKLSLWAHSKTHDVSLLDNMENLLVCVACNQQFMSVSSLSRHVRMQHNECLNLYRCHHCNKTYKTTRELDSHIKQMFCEYDALIINSNYIGGTNSNNSFVVRPKNEPDESSKDVLMDLGNTRIEQIASMDEKDANKPSVKELIRAAKEKTGVTRPRKFKSRLGAFDSANNPYECTICHKSFSRTSNLRQHLRVHTKSKPYPCVKCDARFRHRCSLKTHIAAKHSTVTKLLKCHLCFKFLRSNIALRSHMKMHLGKVERTTHMEEATREEEEIVQSGFINAENMHTVDMDEIKIEYAGNKSAKKLKCIYCHMTFDCMETYNNHDCQYDIKQHKDDDLYDDM